MRFSLDKIRVERKPVEDHKLVLTLPHLPPSTNNLYMNTSNGRVKTRNYDDWLLQAGLFLNGQKPGRMTGRVDVSITVEDSHPQRDIDNILKPTLDLIVKIGVIADDNARHVRSVSAQWSDRISGMEIQIVRAA
jgi:Holliday junction resolvase RusA-like endonuclease